MHPHLTWLDYILQLFHLPFVKCGPKDCYESIKFCKSGRIDKNCNANPVNINAKAKYAKDL